VAVHALHQHDAPGCDFTAEKIIKELGVQGYTRFDGAAFTGWFFSGRRMRFARRFRMPFR